MRNFTIELNATENSECSLASTLRMIASQIERGCLSGFDSSDEGEYEYDVFVETIQDEEEQDEDEDLE